LSLTEPPIQKRGRGLGGIPEAEFEFSIDGHVNIIQLRGIVFALAGKAKKMPPLGRTLFAVYALLLHCFFSFEFDSSPMPCKI
jgi:hypothetical protein